MPKVGQIPGIKKLPKPNGYFTWYWAASQRMREADGFRPRTARLWHGLGEPSPDEFERIKESAARLSQDLQDWRIRSRRQKLGRPSKGPAPSKRSPRGSIYLIRAGERIKIGFTRNVKRRLSQLQTFYCEPLVVLAAVPGTMLMERELHYDFRDLRVANEWFRADMRLVNFAVRLNAAGQSGEAWKLFPSERQPMPERERTYSEPFFQNRPFVRIAG